MAQMRRQAGGAFRAGILAAGVVVGCGGRTADSPPDEGSGSAMASASGRANATSGVGSGSTAGTVTETSGTLIGASGTTTETSGTFVGASGTTTETSGTFIGTSGTVAATSGTVFFGTSSGATSGTVFLGSSGTLVATSGTVFFGTSGTATSGTFVGTSGTLVATSGTTTVTGASACGAGASTVPVSFSNDLMPILQSSCSVGGTDNATALCHGATMVNMDLEPGGSREYFGPPVPPVTQAATLTMIWEGIVDESSSEDPSMSVVAPGDPTESFLWYKVNGIQSTLDNTNACGRGDFGNCGGPMPLPLTGIAITLLPQADRDLICNWIAQGAPNN